MTVEKIKRLANLRGQLVLAEAGLYRWVNGLGGAQGTNMGDIADHRLELEAEVVRLRNLILEVEGR